MTIVVVTAAPIDPPIVRMLAFIPLATPVWPGGTAAMMRFEIAAVPPSQTGVASGMNANIRTIGGSIGAAVTTTIVTSHAGASGLPLESGYTEGFAFLLVAGLLAVLAATLIPREGAERVAIPRMLAVRS